MTETGRLHPGMAFPDITPCGLAHHDATGHHATCRNFSSSTAASRRPETFTDARELLAHPREELRLTRDELRRLRAACDTEENVSPAAGPRRFRRTRGREAGAGGNASQQNARSVAVVDRRFVVRRLHASSIEWRPRPGRLGRVHCGVARRTFERPPENSRRIVRVR